MVSVRDSKHQQVPDDIHLWLRDLGIGDTICPSLAALYLRCAERAQERGDGEQLLAHGREMVAILATMALDHDSYAAAMLLPLVNAEVMTLVEVTTDVSPTVARLIENVGRMEAIRALQSVGGRDPTLHQVDNLRHMLLAMVEDVRAVVIKLAERICYLHTIKNADEETRVMAARETTDIYAPLANRLGIGQLKWELEDFAFRYQHPDIYKHVARQLDEKRLARERFIAEFVANLNQSLSAEGIKADVYGRPKHIYSIWKKMQRKQLDFTDLYDVRAVRVIVDKIQDCYAALGVVHTQFHHLPKEFDDYIANPKPNGYRSIHTVVVGPEGKTVEIQIRTRQMHQDSELGVAAHWKYKEGASAAKGSYEEKIAWLRKILAWQEEMAESGNLVEELRNQVFEDRVYVFTPKGDVVDLPVGSTPLDFAYHVHSMVGHRCVGAKIAGRIVPFTYKLQTGDQVEILTSREPSPSRDWLNPDLGYLNSSRARAKVQQWFRLQDRDKNLEAGRHMLEAELSRCGLKMADASQAVERFNVTSLDDLLAAIGAGDVRLNQVVNHLQQKFKKQPDDDEIARMFKRVGHQPSKRDKDSVVVDGVGNLLTHMSRCCQPVPGDTITGYITQGRGISVHRSDCEQLLDLLEAHPERAIDVSWGESYAGGYTVTIRVVASDRSGLLRDITTILANEKINVLGVKSHSDVKTQTAVIDMEMEVYNIDRLTKVLTLLNNMNDIMEAKRL